MSYLGRSAKLSLKAQEKVSFLATAGQTSKTGLSYVPSFVEVYVNGILLTDTTDFTATNGNSVTFTVALSLNDEVTVISLKTFTVADHYTISAANTLLSAKLPKAGGAMTGPITGAEFNRLSTDGTIVDLQKDGTTVGSIGIESGGLVIDGEAGHTGLRFANDSVLPRDNGVTTDGGDDLGSSTSRWRDAYLSGGVYLGGSGSSNKLDDYETGSWTPVVSGGTLSISIARASYVKAGSLVYVQCYITGSSGGDATTMALTGLPFTVVSNGWALGSVNYNDTAVTNPQARAHQSSTRVEFKKNGDNNMTQTELNGGHIIFSITYEAA